MTRVLLAAAVLVLLVTAGGAGAFEDTVQRYPTGAISDFWSITGTAGGVTKVASPVAYPSNYIIRVYIHHYTDTTYMTPYDSHNLNYFSFVNRYYNRDSGGLDFWLNYYDTDGALIDQSTNIGGYIQSYSDNHLHEFIKSGNSILYYINGTYMLTIASVADNVGYIALEVEAGSGPNYPQHETYLDDFTSVGSIIGTNEIATDDLTYIDASYSIRSMFSFPTAVYDMRLRHVSSGETINTTVLPSSTGDAPCGFMHYNRADVFGTKYGLYHLTLNRDGTNIGETYFWYQSGTSLGSVSWGKDTYSTGESGTISYSLITPDFGAYTYKIKTMGTDGATDESWTISDESGTKTVDLTDYDIGLEYVIFTRTDKASGDVVEFSYDYTTLSETVVIFGNTTNAITGEAMEDVTVPFKQGTEWYNTTSASDGTYNLTDLSTDIQITCNANTTYENYAQTTNETFNSSDYDTWINLSNDMITSGSVLVSNTTDETPFTISTDYNINYTDGRIMILSTGSMINWTDYHIDYNTTESFNISTFYFTPLEPKAYYIDLYLFNANHTYENTSIYGLVGNSHYYQAVENATVTIWNATWSNTTQTTATGYYVFHNLNNSTAYNLNASANGYETSSNRNTTAIGNATRQDIQLEQLFTVAIKAKDATTTAYINTFTAYINTQTNATITGTATFTNVKYGVYSVSVAAEGYYPDATTAIIDEDETTTLTLVQMESQYYTPHYVKFKVTSIFGVVYPNVAVIVYEGADASGDTYADGTTGSDGAVVFKLTENLQYTLTFTNATQGISKTVTLYPKDGEYYIIVGTTDVWSDYEHRKHDNIHIAITKSVINDSHAYINISYSDDLNGTTFLEAYLNQTNLTDPYNQTIIAHHTFTGDLNNTNHSFLISPHAGEAFFARVHHEHTEFGTFYDHTVRFFGMRVDLGIPSGTYIYICIILTLFMGAVFGGTSTQVGSVIICVMGWLFLAFGWLHPALGWFAEISVTVASIYAVATIITHRARKAGYT